MAFGEKDFLACCGSGRFAKEMAAVVPLSYEQAVDAARDIWFNKCRWSKGEQSTAKATATDTTSQELYDWNTRYKQKFGFIFMICATGRSTPEILAELKRRYPNRPIIEFEIAAKEQMKITELRLNKLFSAATNASLATTDQSTNTDAL